MRQYGAVLAVSSPAHLKSRTASGRVFEGLVSGTPVISDRNPHVIEQFGDLVYYFSGETEQERANSIQAALNQILADPEEANRRVREAQKLIAEEFSFETKLDATLKAINDEHHSALAAAGPGVTVDVILLDHDPWGKPEAVSGEEVFPNLTHILRAAAELQNQSHHRVRITVRSPRWFDRAPADMPANVEFRFSPPHSMRRNGTSSGWAPKCSTPAAWPRTTTRCFSTSSTSRSTTTSRRRSTGRWTPRAPTVPRSSCPASSSTLSRPRRRRALPASCATAVRSACIAGPRTASPSISSAPCSSIAMHWRRWTCRRWCASTCCWRLPWCYAPAMPEVELHRSRHLTLRASEGYFHRYHAVHAQVEAKGFWALQYDMPTNFTHEINALSDAFHESVAAVAVADTLSGHGRPAMPVVPGMERFNYFALQCASLLLKSLARSGTPAACRGSMPGCIIGSDLTTTRNWGCGHEFVRQSRKIRLEAVEPYVWQCVNHWYRKRPTLSLRGKWSMRPGIWEYARSTRPTITGWAMQNRCSGRH